MPSRGGYVVNDYNNGVSSPRYNKQEESEKVPLQQQSQPVKLQPSWEDNNLPEDELNFKSLTMDDASLQLHTPVDRYNLVYLTFILHGVGILMPWNVFINAEEYFTKYKLVGSPNYVSSFLQYLTFAAQVPNVLFSCLNVFIQFGGNLTTRIVWSICIETVIVILTICLAMADSADWPGAFFWITMISVVVLNMANGIYQNTIFGMAAKLPLKYTGAVVLGSNISGTLTAIVNMITKAFAPNTRMSTIYYFITALFVLLVCFDSYFALPLNRFYRHYELNERREIQMRKNNNQGKLERVPYYYIFGKTLPQLVNIYLTFFVSLAIFPAIQANVAPVSESFIVSPDYFQGVTCFLTFNTAAMIGSYLTTYFTWPKAQHLWIFVSLRLLFIPFFLLCNYVPKGIVRALPVIIASDWAYWITAAAMALTSGYFSSLGMMYAPRCVESRHAATAGMFAAAALVIGIFSGVLITFIWPWLITHVGF